MQVPNRTLLKSIGRNGVQVPLIIRDDGKLLDGNRRFFACHWLRLQSEGRGNRVPESLERIPVMVIRTEDITVQQELKILAEANFIKDLKVSWPLDAQARAVYDFYRALIHDGELNKDDALSEVVSVFGITKGRVNDLLDTLELTKKFIDRDDSKGEQIRLRGIVEDKFVYFWEFRNKAMKGRSRYNDAEELKEVTDMFFHLMSKGIDSPIKNVKQIEPLAQARRDKIAWEMLEDSDGAKLKVVVSLINEKKEVRKAEDKIRLFHNWLENTGSLSNSAINYLLKLKTLMDERCKEESS
ncbi:MAG: ParB N-terminal domain-containing protein [Candidatus Polarisedimenticolaceae bacterium]|nr:ParB N-terminal domain-containing protein [Candidatus Polarisedimenticolaceae bacterium]